MRSVGSLVGGAGWLARAGCIGGRGVVSAMRTEASLARNPVASLMRTEGSLARSPKGSLMRIDGSLPRIGSYPPEMLAGSPGCRVGARGIPRPARAGPSQKTRLSPHHPFAITARISPRERPG